MKKKTGIVILTVLAFMALIACVCGTTIAFLTAKTGENSVENTFYAKELDAVNLIIGRDVGRALRGDPTRSPGGEPGSDNTIKKVIIGCLKDYLTVITPSMEAGKIHVGETNDDKVYVYNAGGETVYILSDDDVLINSNPDSARFFQNMHALETIEFGDNFRLPTSGNIEVLGKKGVSLLYMFGNCEKLTTIKGINKTTFNTSGVVRFESLFDNCYALPTKQIQDIVDVMVTDKAVMMYRMFENCRELTAIDLTGWKTPDNTDLQYFFFGCSKLEKIDVNFGTGKFDTSHVICFTGMFEKCEKLDNDDFNGLLVNSGLDTSSVQVMTSMFSGCTGVTELNVSCFDTSKVGTGDASNCFCTMFAGCTNLQNIIGLTNFDVSNAYAFAGMFKNCSSLTKLDLSSFDLRGLGLKSRGPEMDDSDSAKVAKYRDEIINSMFYGCSSLRTIEVSDQFVVSDVIKLGDETHSYVREMFNGCVNLVGGNGTVYDAAHADGLYAHIDGGAGNPGYLTLKR